MTGNRATTNDSGAFIKRRTSFVAIVFVFLFVLVAAGASSSSTEEDPAAAIDFSHAGYGGGGVPLPRVAAAVTVRPSGGDDTELLQAALDHVAQMPARADGFRGAVQLAPGRFKVAGGLRLRAGGVVLRGSVEGSQRTFIVATGKSRRTLIEVGGGPRPSLSREVRVTDEKAAAGARTLTLESSDGIAVGQRVVVTRPSTAEWIAALEMNKAAGSFADQRTHWQPGSRDLAWDRTVLSVDTGRKTITLDAPITTALERRYGGGTVAKVDKESADKAVTRVGVESLTLESESDVSNPHDEEHAWIAVALDNVEDAWVRDVTARGFAGSAVRVGRGARRVTVEECRSERPVSEVGGYRRQSFLVEGQQVLVRRSESEAGLNDFAAGLLAAGPNVFLDCTARGALGPSGTFESWASGVLYERVRVEGAALRLTRDDERAQGGGWTAANSVVWNSEAKEIEARGPEGAPVIVRRSAESLYETQLARRVGRAVKVEQPLTKSSQSAKLTRAREFKFKRAAPPKSKSASLEKYPLERVNSRFAVGGPLEVVNGRFVVAGRVVWGGMLNGAWWKGQTSPRTAARAAGVSITRFVPGRVGPGLTEDLDALTARMVEQGMPFFNGGPGLWYDRRRDDHTITERADANVWAPFYEMPWARSGRGKAWDGLSKYDLARFNPWYFERTREFAQLAARRGLVYYHNLYNTHNLLETTAHWVDFPWRPANNVNDTGLPEPPPVEARNTVHLANEFYSTEHAPLRALHRAYIRHNLEQLGASPNVLFILGFQYAGPLSFQQFFHDTVAEWERETGRRARVALITSKEITDAILADPARARQVAVIDMRYWQYMPDGKLWAPRAGQNLAFREIIAKDFGRAGDTPPPTTPRQLYRQVREYRDRFPDKAVVAWHGGAGPIPILMAGGAQALLRNPAAGQSQGTDTDATPLDAFIREHLPAALMKMTPRDNFFADRAEDNWCLADESRTHVLVYSLAGDTIKLAAPLPQLPYTGVWFDPRTGATTTFDVPTETRRGVTIRKPTGEDWLLLLLPRSI